jgi:hypothetical protein
MLPHPDTVSMLRVLQYQERLRDITKERLAASADAETTVAHASRDSIIRSMCHRGREAKRELPEAGLILAEEMKCSPHAPGA